MVNGTPPTPQGPNFSEGAAPVPAASLRLPPAQASYPINQGRLAQSEHNFRKKRFLLIPNFQSENTQGQWGKSNAPWDPVMTRCIALGTSI